MGRSHGLRISNSRSVSHHLWQPCFTALGFFYGWTMQPKNLQLLLKKINTQPYTHILYPLLDFTLHKRGIGLDFATYYRKYRSFTPFSIAPSVDFFFTEEALDLTLQHTIENIFNNGALDSTLQHAIEMIYNNSNRITFTASLATDQRVDTFDSMDNTHYLKHSN